MSGKDSFYDLRAADASLWWFSNKAAGRDAAGGEERIAEITVFFFPHCFRRFA